VGFPRESSISLALTDLILTILSLGRIASEDKSNCTAENEGVNRLPLE